MRIAHARFLSHTTHCLMEMSKSVMWQCLLVDWGLDSHQFYPFPFYQLSLDDVCGNFWCWIFCKHNIFLPLYQLKMKIVPLEKEFNFLQFHIYNMYVLDQLVSSKCVVSWACVARFCFLGLCRQVLFPGPVSPGSVSWACVARFCFLGLCRQVPFPGPVSPGSVSWACVAGF